MPRPRQEERAQRMYGLYQEGYSLGQVAAVFGISRQSVYDVFRVRGWPLRSRQLLPVVTYKGETYSLDPYGYLRKTSGDRKLLHQAVWEEYHGPIPDGYEIHHRDENKLHNDESNLACVSPTAHAAFHHELLPVPEQRCLYCGAVLTRKRSPSGQLETPAAVVRRQYCNTTCHSAHKRGKPRGWSARRERSASEGA